jgi:hypothetical protein
VDKNKEGQKETVIDFVNRNSKKFIITAVIIAGVGLAALFGLVESYQNVVAVVGTNVITKSQVDRQLQLNENVSNYTKDATNNSFSAATNQLINEALIEKAASDNNISVSSSDIQAQVNKIAKDSYSGKPSLVYQSYNQSYGYTKSELDTLIYYNLLDSKVVAKLVENKTGNAITIKYQPNIGIEKANNIQTTDLATWAELTADNLYNQLQAGTSFSSLMGEIYGKYQDNPAYGYKGFQNLTSDSTDPAFTSLEIGSIMLLKPGQYSPVIDVNGEFYAIYNVNSEVKGSYQSQSDLLTYYQNKYLIYKNTSIAQNLLGNLVAKVFEVNSAYADPGGCGTHGSSITTCACACDPPSYIFGYFNGNNGYWYPSGGDPANCASEGPSHCSSGGGSGGGSIPPVPTPQPINGGCGSAKGGSFLDQPDGDLCSSGSHTSVSESGDKWIWSCDGANGGSNQSCSATVLQSLKVDETGCPADPANDDHVRVEDTDGKISCKKNCSADYTKNATITLKPIIWSPESYAFLGWDHCTNYVTKDGVQECQMHMNVDRVNPAPTAEFGYKVTISVNGNGAVEDNQSPHKINCKSSAGNITICSALYSSTNVKFTASSNSPLTDPFVSWKNSQVCGTSTGSTCSLGDRCETTSLVANFNENSVTPTQPTQATCSIVPNNGTAPLVLKLNANNQQAGDLPYKFNITDQSNGVVSNILQPNSSPVFYTATTSGVYNINLSNNTDTWTTSCPTVTVSNSNTTSGGEVAP